MGDWEKKGNGEEKCKPFSSKSDRNKLRISIVCKKQLDMKPQGYRKILINKLLYYIFETCITIFSL